MAPATDSSVPTWIRFRMNPRGLQKIKGSRPGQLAFETIGGSVLVKMDEWTKAGSRLQRNPGGWAAFPNTVLIDVIDGLSHAAGGLRGLGTAFESVYLSGTPIELRLRSRGKEIEIQLVEDIGYGSEQRVLGRKAMDLDGFTQSISRLLLNFARSMIRANPSFANDGGVKSIRNDAEQLRPRSNSSLG